MSIKLLSVFLLLTGCTGWTTADTARHSAYTALFAADTVQTLEIARKPDQYHERNPILGDHPSENEVMLYMGAAYIITTGIAIALPLKYRLWWQYGLIGIEAACVANNYAIGLRFGF